MAGPLITSEVGFEATGTPDILQKTERGILRVLHTLSLISGLFDPSKLIAEDVAPGAPVGLIHRPDTPQSKPDAITSPYEGIVSCRRAMAEIVRGDAVFRLRQMPNPAGETNG